MHSSLCPGRLIARVDAVLMCIASRSTQLVVVHFWSSWAPQCQQITDVLNELAKNRDLGQIRYVQVC